jgi:ATP-dependent Clp protease ATP-binding subunit ClpA
MTSNIGSHLIMEAFENVSEKNIEAANEKAKVEVMNLLRQTIRPEFLNRVDEVIVFDKLSRDEVHEIVDLMVARDQRQMAAQGFNLEFTDAARDVLADKGYDPELGARPLRRAIQQHVEDPLSERILWKEFAPGATVLVDAEDGEIVFRSEEGIEPPQVELAGSGSEG